MAATRLFARYGAALLGLAPVAHAAHMNPRTAEQFYSNRDDLLADILSEHVLALHQTVCAAFDAAAGSGPRLQLEAAACAWLDHTARHTDAHRCLLFCGHLLADQARASILGRYQVTLETVTEPLRAAHPALAARAEAVASLQASLAAALNDAGFWPTAPDSAECARRARRIAGMLLAAGAAEQEGAWPELGATAGAADRAITIASRAARTRLPTLLDLVAAGTEVVITRRGKKRARLVKAG